MPSRKLSPLTWTLPAAFALLLAGAYFNLHRKTEQDVKRHVRDTAQGATLLADWNQSLYLDLRVGEVNEEGQLLFWRLNDLPGGDPFFLRPGDDYGAILINQQIEDRPLARYILASQSTRRVLDTLNFSEFRRALASIPHTATIGIYGTCTVSRASGLPIGVFESFDKALQRSGAKVDPERPRIICYCREP